MAVAATTPPTAAVSVLLRSGAGDRARHFADMVATTLVALSAIIGVVVLVAILAYVTINGLPSLNLAFFTERPLPPGEVGGGVAPAIVGTLLMLATAGLIGIPIGIGTAIYLAEYGRRGFAQMVSFTIDLIAGLPSIV